MELAAAAATAAAAPTIVRPEATKIPMALVEPSLSDNSRSPASEAVASMSRGRFAVTQCTGICSMIILLFVTFIMLMYKIEGADRLALAVISQHYNVSL